MTLIISVVSAEGIGRSINQRVPVHEGVMYWYLSSQRGSLGTPRSLGCLLQWVMEVKVGDWRQSLGCPSQAEPTSAYFPWWMGTYMITLERASLVTDRGGRLGVEAQCKVPLHPLSLTTLNSFMVWWWVSRVNPLTKCWLWSWLFSGKLDLDAFCGVISTECCQRAALCARCLALPCFLQYWESR